MWAVASRGGRGGCQDQPGGASLWALAQLTSWLPYLGNLAAAQPAGQGLLPGLPPQTWGGVVGSYNHQDGAWAAPPDPQGGQRPFVL